MKSVDEIIEFWGYRLTKSLLGTDKDNTVVNRGDMRAVLATIHSLRQRLAEAEAKVPKWEEVRNWDGDTKPGTCLITGKRRLNGRWIERFHFTDKNGMPMSSHEETQYHADYFLPLSALPAPPEGDKTP